MKRIAICAAITALILHTTVLFSAPQSLKQLNNDMKAVTTKVLPTVVSISAVRQGGSGGAGFGLPFGEGSAKALGSGVIIDKRGYIVTNYHVIKSAKKLNITLYDEREFECTVVGSDPPTDLAVIKIDGDVPKNLPVATLANSDQIVPGQIAIAVGNAFGFSNTVTMGIVSAVKRENLGIIDYTGLIQTDAAINPGNSGGALVDVDGKLIGINTAIYSRSGGSDGLGFAIPSNHVRRISKELIANGKIIRGWLGVQITDLSSSMAEEKGLKKGQKGAYVAYVAKDSPAGGADIKKGDIIVKVDGKSIGSVNSLRKTVAAMKPGKTVVFTLVRSGEEFDVTVEIGTLPQNKNARNDEKKSGADAASLGLKAADIDERNAYEYSIEEKHGVVVLAVDAGSAAAKAGFIEGDLVKELEMSAVANNVEFEELIWKHRNKKRLQLMVRRRGQLRNVVLDRE